MEILKIKPILTDARFAAVLRHLGGLQGADPVVLCPEAVTSGSKRRPGVVLDACLADVPLYRLVDLWTTGRALGSATGLCGRSDEARAHLAPLTSLLPGFALDAVPESGAVVIRVDTPPVSRRGLLGLSSGAPATGHIATDDAGRLVESLRAAGVAAPDSPAPGLRLAASDCTACGRCVRVCPHDALTLDIIEGEAVLTQNPEVCRGAGACMASCPVDALADEGPLTMAEALSGTPRRLATVAVRFCARCRTPYPAASDPRLCPICRARAVNPFGIVLPDAAARLGRASGPQTGDDAPRRGTS